MKPPSIYLVPNHDKLNDKQMYSKIDQFWNNTHATFHFEGIKPPPFYFIVAKSRHYDGTDVYKILCKGTQYPVMAQR